jgi:hypothetical protein
MKRPLFLAGICYLGTMAAVFHLGLAAGLADCLFWRARRRLPPAACPGRRRGRGRFGPLRPPLFIPCTTALAYAPRSPGRRGKSLDSRHCPGIRTLGQYAFLRRGGGYRGGSGGGTQP